MSSDSDDDEVGQTWISVRSLKHAADIKTVYRSHNEDITSPHSSLNSSVTAESAPNPVINVSPSFSHLHESYMNLRDEHTESRRVVSHSRDSSASTNRMVTRRAQEEVLELQHELLTAHRENDHLRTELAARDQQHALQLQMIQAHHERKMQRSRHDFEELMRQQPKQQFESTMKQLKSEQVAEINQLCNQFEEQIDQLKVEHELELQGKEEDYIKSLEELREKLQQEAEDRESELIQLHEIQLEKVEKRHKLEIAQLTKSGRSSEVTRFRRVPKLEIVTDFSPSEGREVQTLEAEIAALRRKNEEQEMVIKGQEAALEDLKATLSSAFRKKSPEPKSIHVSRIGLLDVSDDLGNSQGLESELKQIISQIEYLPDSVHLDEEHLNSTQSFSDTLKNLKGRIEGISGSQV